MTVKYSGALTKRRDLGAFRLSDGGRRRRRRRDPCEGRRRGLRPFGRGTGGPSGSQRNAGQDEIIALPRRGGVAERHFPGQKCSGSRSRVSESCRPRWGQTRLLDADLVGVIPSRGADEHCVWSGFVMGFQTASAANPSLYKAEICHGSALAALGSAASGRGERGQPGEDAWAGRKRSFRRNRARCVTAVRGAVGTPAPGHGGRAASGAVGLGDGSPRRRPGTCCRPALCPAWGRRGHRDGADWGCGSGGGPAPRRPAGRRQAGNLWAVSPRPPLPQHLPASHPPRSAAPGSHVQVGRRCLCRATGAALGGGPPFGHP